MAAFGRFLTVTSVTSAWSVSSICLSVLELHSPKVTDANERPTESCSSILLVLLFFRLFVRASSCATRATAR